MHDWPSPSKPSGQDSHSNEPFATLWQFTEGKQGSPIQGPVLKQPQTKKTATNKQKNNQTRVRNPGKNVVMFKPESIAKFLLNMANGW